jgi:shikimate kinase
MNRPIIITGFMGAGKTTLASALGRKLDLEAIDLDQSIQQSEGRTIKQLIEQDGEPAFREIETKSLETVLASDSAQVIALGGGTWMCERNRDLISQRRGITVWLDASFELCWERIAAGGSERPLAPDQERAKALYDDRRKVYKQAVLHVAVDNNSDVAELAEKIGKTLAADYADFTD